MIYKKGSDIRDRLGINNEKEILLGLFFTMYRSRT